MSTQDHTTPEPEATQDEAQADNPNTTSEPRPSRRTGWMIIVALIVAAALLLFAKQRTTGIWEPWEAQELFIAQEYLQRAPVTSPEALTGHNWAVPTLNQKPVATSLLKIWLLNASMPKELSDVGTLLGTLELRSRLPFALIMAALAMAVFAWTRRRFSQMAGLYAGLASLSVPVVALGVHNLVTPTLAIATSAMALLSASLLLDEEDALPVPKRWLFAALAGLGLGLGFLDQRLLGVCLPLEVLLLLGLTELGPEQRPNKAQLAAALAIVLAPAIYAFTIRAQLLKAPHLAQVLYLSAHVCFMAATLTLSARSRVGRLFFSRYGLLMLAIPAAIIIPVMMAYAQVNPTLLDQGQITGKIPVLSFILEQNLWEKSFGKEHIHFDLWVRQIGFATFPWFALIPAALGYLVRSEQLRDEAGLSPRRRLDERMLVIWAGAGFVVSAIASIYGQVFFTAYIPLLIAVGVMLADEHFWRQLRRQPLLLYAMGFVAVAIIMTLGKDIERYPNRFLELYMGFEKDLKLPEGFSFSRLHKPLKYGLALMLIATIFGLTSWAGVWVGRLHTVQDEFKRLLGLSPASEPSMMEAQAQLKEQLRETGKGPIARLARLLEVPPGQSLIISGAFTLAGLLFVFAYQPSASDHLSQRHIFESYMNSPGQKTPLYRYQTPSNSASIYLKDLPQLASSQALIEKIEAPERLYAIIPRERLSAVNAEVRERLKRNVYVLNARSNRLVLISDELSPGEEDHNYIARAIIPEDKIAGELQHPFKVTEEGKSPQAATMDGQLEFLGYSLDKSAAKDGITAYKGGDKMALSLYFKVLKRVPGSKKIFLHIDTQGNRLHGDHDPVGGEFPTNSWSPGDIIKDTHTIEVEPYSTKGVYTIFMGLYQGNDRMKVQPRKAHDGVNRIPVGKIRVE